MSLRLQEEEWESALPLGSELAWQLESEWASASH
jgi:hypothetical protein